MLGHQKKRLMLMACSLAGLFLLPCSTAHAALSSVSTCGQQITTPGQYVLTTDIDCATAPSNGIEIMVSDVTLFLAGHKIRSSACDPSKGISGIVVDGGLSGVLIEGGTIEGFNDGIVLYSSNSRVAAMTIAKACFFGIAVSGKNNQIDTSEVISAGLDGIGVGAAQNTLIRYNFISDNARVGVDISNFSDNNVVESNVISRNGLVDNEQGGIAIFNGQRNTIANNALNNNFNGIEVESPNNLVRGNLVNGSVEYGIFTTSGGNLLTLNTVLGSKIGDMSDSDAACSTNTWKKNFFVSDFASGIPDGGPSGGCVR